MKIKDIRVLDPVTSEDAVMDLNVSFDPLDGFAVEDFSDGSAYIAIPSAIDLHVHFREPGGEDSETLESGVRAAIRGGFGTVVTMPNTNPPVDNEDALRFQISGERYSRGKLRILPSACCTMGRKGRIPVNPEELPSAAAFTDDGSMVGDDSVMETVMARCAQCGKPVMDHAVSPALSRGGVIRDCRTARENGLSIFPDEAETQAVMRDCTLSGRTGCRVHIQHISCGASIGIIREAQDRGWKVTAEATPHHLLLCAEDIPSDDANWKMTPPLGTANDVRELRNGVACGAITCFATDHAPHSPAKKAGGFAKAMFGVTGLETALPATWLSTVSSSVISPLQWAQMWTTRPASVLGIRVPSIAHEPGAGVTVLKMEPWTVPHADFASKSSNTPFAGMTLPCKVAAMCFTE